MAKGFMPPKLRQLLYRVHQVAGLTLGLLWALLGVSGSLLVFRPQIENAQRPAVKPGGASTSLQAASDRVLDGREGRRLARWILPQTVGQPWEFVLQVRGARNLKEAQLVSVYVDPSTGAILGERAHEGGFFAFLRDFHFALFGGVTGLRVNGWLAVALGLFALPGLALWWPGWGNVRGALWGQPGGFAWSWHRAGGFWSSAFLLLWSLTGASFAFREPVTDAVLWLTASAPPERPPTVILRGIENRVPLDQLWQTAREQVPTARLTVMRYPGAPAQPFAFTAESSGGEHTIFLDPYGKVLRVDRPEARSAGTRLLAAFTPWHTGAWGGVAAQALWALFGLAPAALFATGVTMGWRRWRTAPRK
jgi:vanillate O-demethylase ferredoxin subunit